MSAPTGPVRIVTIMNDGTPEKPKFRLGEKGGTYAPQFAYKSELIFTLDGTKFPPPANIDFVKFYGSQEDKKANKVLWTWTHSSGSQNGREVLPLEFRPTITSEDKRAMKIVNSYDREMEGPATRQIFFAIVINDAAREDRVFDPELQIMKEYP